MKFEDYGINLDDARKLSTLFQKLKHSEKSGLYCHQYIRFQGVSDKRIGASILINLWTYYNQSCKNSLIPIYLTTLSPWHRSLYLKHRSGRFMEGIEHARSKIRNLLNKYKSKENIIFWKFLGLQENPEFTSLIKNLNEILESIEITKQPPNEFLNDDKEKEELIENHDKFLAIYSDERCNIESELQELKQLDILAESLANAFLLGDVDLLFVTSKSILQKTLRVAKITEILLKNRWHETEEIYQQKIKDFEKDVLALETKTLA